MVGSFTITPTESSYFSITDEIVTINDESFSVKEKESLKTRIRELNTKIENANSEEELYNYVKERMEMTSFISELHNDEYKDDFEADKNRLITLMAKNKNIYGKLNNNKMNFYIMLGVLVLYVIGLIFMYVQMGLMELDVQATVLIAISMCVLLFFVVYDVYTIATRRHYEGFQDTDIDTDIIQEEINKYVNEILPVLVKIETKVLGSERTSQRHDVIKNILHDFNNLNYINMRQYQLTDYKINETRNRMHFVKYAFLMFSIIGIIAGLELRTRAGLPDNSLPISQGFLITASVIMMLTYLFVLLMHQKQNKMRKKYNWNKLYWNLKATHGDN